MSRVYRKWSPASPKKLFTYRLSCQKMAWAPPGSKGNTHWRCQPVIGKQGEDFRQKIESREGRFEQMSWKIFPVPRVPEFTISTTLPDMFGQKKLLGKSQAIVNFQLTRGSIQSGKELNRHKWSFHTRLPPETRPAFKHLIFEF